MIKEASVIHPVQSVIRKRWSARSFASRPVAQETLDHLLEAASWAFSSMNEQPWRYVYAHNGTEAFRKMCSCLAPANQIWAKNAPVLVLSIAKTFFDLNGQPNSYALHDVGAANATLFIEATAQGITGHVMGGFDQELTREEFSLPEGYKPVVFIALGYPGAADSLPEPLRTRELAPRTRKPLHEIAFGNEFTNRK